MELEGPINQPVPICYIAWPLPLQLTWQPVDPSFVEVWPLSLQLMQQRIGPSWLLSGALSFSHPPTPLEIISNLPLSDASASVIKSRAWAEGHFSLVLCQHSPKAYSGSIRQTTNWGHGSKPEVPPPPPP